MPDGGAPAASASATAHDAKLVAIILALFMALCVIYNAALPIFEAPDEASHFRYAHYLATERRLPDLRQDLPSHEVTQPLLYYALTAFVISPFDQTNLDALIRLNPDWFEPALNPNYTGVRGQHLHTPAENFPYQGAVWAVRAGRLFSSVLGAITIVLVYLIARHVFGSKTIGRPEIHPLSIFTPPSPSWPLQSLLSTQNSSTSAASSATTLPSRWPPLWLAGGWRA